MVVPQSFDALVVAKIIAALRIYQQVVQIMIATTAIPWASYLNAAMIFAHRVSLLHPILGKMGPNAMTSIKIVEHPSRDVVPFSKIDTVIS